MADAPVQPAAPVATAPVAPDVAPVAAPPLPAGTGPDINATMAEASPYVKTAETATQQATASAQQDTTPAPQPHAKLLAMIQGLSVGLSSFGTAMGTKGKEGGAPEVEQYYAGLQQQKIQAQKAAQDQQNAKTQRYLTIADTNMKTAQSIMLLHTMPTDLQTKDAELTGKKLGNIGAAQDVRTKALQDLQQTGDVDAYNATLSQLGGVSGAAPAGPAGAAPTAGAPAAAGATPALPPVVVSAWQNSVDAASAAYPNDTAIGAAKTTMADPNATPQQKAMAARQATSRMTSLDTGVSSQTKQQAQQETAPFGDKAAALNEAMLKRYQVLNPGATALPAGFAMDAKSTPKDFDRADKIMQQTETSAATQAQRDTANAMRQQTLALSGLGAPGGNTKLTGDAYLGSLPDPEQALVKEIGTGKAAPTRMDYLLSRNPKLTAEVALAYPDWDSSKAASYPAVYKDYTSGPASVAINSGGTALGHLAELQALNTTESHIPHTPDWTKYQNKVDTVASELAKFYGDTTIPAIASIKSTLASTLPGNREAAIQTQAQSMGDKLDSYENQWAKAAPSKVYEAPMPGLSEHAKDARAQLDSKYAATRKPATALPQGATHTVPGPDGKNHYTNATGTVDLGVAP